MDTVEKAILNNVGDFYYKTPSYTRKAYKDYYNRNKEDTEFISKRKKAQAEYYQRNKEKILEKKRINREKKKEANQKLIEAYNKGEVELDSVQHLL